jgi:3-hydroxyisobutyrate dehydrogenase-like beta-hydroxyacid dehydrogenase
MLTAIGKRLFVVGEEPFQANGVKLCGNFLLLSAIEGLAESVAFARQQGIAPSILVNILTETLFTAPFYKTYGSLTVEDRYEPAGFRMQLGLKDADLLLEEAVRVGLLMPSASTVRDRLRIAVARGLRDRDVAALVLLRSDRSELTGPHANYRI